MAFGSGDPGLEALFANSYEMYPGVNCIIGREASVIRMVGRIDKSQQFPSA
jgi:hypothetical protein